MTPRPECVLALFSRAQRRYNAAGGSMSQQTAWVTGGGTGIGLGIARALADDGFRVYISGRREAVLAEAAREYAGDTGTGELIPLKADVTDEAGLDGAVSRIRSEAGRVDVAAISAGINVTHRSFADTTAEEWRRIMEINATGTFLVMKSVFNLMKEQGGGLIVNVSSVAGLRPLAMAGVAYSASKYASRSLGIFAGNELADAKIRVTNVYPGEVSTPILDQRTNPPPAEKRAQMVQPEEIGQVVSLIARMPDTAHVSELVIKPRYQELV